LRLLLEKVPLLVLSAASAWITMKVQAPAEGTTQAFPLLIRIENAVVAYGLYLWKMIWPARLAAFYPHSAEAPPAWQWMLSAMILLSVTALVLAVGGKRYLAVGWFWFLGTLVPVIGLVQVGGQSMADRFAYIPLIGIFVMIAFGLADLANAKSISTAWRAVPACSVVAALSFVTLRQMRSWESEYALWSHALEVTDVNLSAHAQNALGSALLDPDKSMTPHDVENFSTPQKRMDEARGHFEKALMIERQLEQEHPSADLTEMPTTLINLGYIDELENRTGDERQHYQEALTVATREMARNPASYLPMNVAATTSTNLGNLDRKENRTDEALQHYVEAMQINRQLALRNSDRYLPDLAEALSRLGLAEKTLTHLDDARQHDEEALSLDRRLVEQDPDRYQSRAAGILVNLGNLDILQNRLGDARQHFQLAVDIYQQQAARNPAVNMPNLLTALNNLGNLDRLQNRTNDARQHFEAALAIGRKLAQQSPGKYTGEIAKAEASLRELGKSR
jgi:tetratricopeptide (TPR) repeat protein